MIFPTQPFQPKPVWISKKAQLKQEEEQILQSSSYLEEGLGKEGLQRGTSTLTHGQGPCRYRCVNVSPAQSCACCQLQIMQGRFERHSPAELWLLVRQQDNFVISRALSLSLKHLASVWGLGMLEIPFTSGEPKALHGFPQEQSPRKH